MKRYIARFFVLAILVLSFQLAALADSLPYPSPSAEPTAAPVIVGEDAAPAPQLAVDQNGAADVFSPQDLYLAAQLIYAEGKAQSDESFLAMACVVYNRLQSKKFPSTMEGVVFAPNQFTVTRNREKFLALVPSERAQYAVQAVFINGERPVPENVMFFKSARLKKSWGKRVYYATIGGNMYYS